MPYQHGVSVSEVSTSISPSVAASTIPVVFGTAPINLSNRDALPINEPILCTSYSEAVNAFGYSDDWNFTLNEFIHSHFALFGASAAILVNVLDPDSHKSSVANKPVTVTDGIALVSDQGIIKNSVVVKSSDGVTTYVKNDDFVLDYDKQGRLVIQRLADGSIPANTTTLSVTFDKLDPSKVTASDLIGGVDLNGNLSGLELLNQVFPRFRVVPGLVLAPGFSYNPTVAAVMNAKASNINNNFKCIVLTDIPTDTVKNHTDAPKWIQDNNYTSPRQLNCFPKLILGDKQYHTSTQLAGVLCTTDAANDGIPYVSPSNQNFKANGAVLEDGTPIFLGPDQAAYLNGNGIITALNFIGGWKAWGNRTGAYPSVTDPKDSFIPIRRMMDWISNTIILTYWQKLDSPITRRLTEAITDSINLWLNGLTAQGYLLGGRVEFKASENSLVDLADGILRFHVYVTPPSPARDIEFVLEYDAQYLNGLFG